MELAIDTSTRYASVALAHQGDLLWEESWRSERNHTVELLPAVQRLLSRAQVSLNDLTGVAVARGPGSFSALRVGLSLSKGLALGLGIPIVGVSTLLVEALPYLSMGVPVYALLDAGRGQVAWASFLGERAMDQAPDVQVADVASLCAGISSPAVLCGEGVALHAQEFQGQQTEGLMVATAPAPTRRAAVVAYLGAQRLMGGDYGDVATLQPVYMRGPSITPPGKS